MTAVFRRITAIAAILLAAIAASQVAPLPAEAQDPLPDLRIIIAAYNYGNNAENGLYSLSVADATIQPYYQAGSDVIPIDPFDTAGMAMIGNTLWTVLDGPSDTSLYRSYGTGDGIHSRAVLGLYAGVLTPTSPDTFAYIPHYLSANRGTLWTIDACTGEAKYVAPALSVGGAGGVSLSYSEWRKADMAYDGHNLYTNIGSDLIRLAKDGTAFAIVGQIQTSSGTTITPQGLFVGDNGDADLVGVSLYAITGTVNAPQIYRVNRYSARATLLAITWAAGDVPSETYTIKGAAVPNSWPDPCPEVKPSVVDFYALTLDQSDPDYWILETTVTNLQSADPIAIGQAEIVRTDAPNLSAPGHISDMAYLAGHTYMIINGYLRRGDRTQSAGITGGIEPLKSEWRIAAQSPSYATIPRIAAYDDALHILIQADTRVGANDANPLITRGTMYLLHTDSAGNLVLRRRTQAPIAGDNVAITAVCGASPLADDQLLSTDSGLYYSCNGGTYEISYDGPNRTYTVERAAVSLIPTSGGVYSEERQVSATLQGQAYTFARPSASDTPVNPRAVYPATGGYRTLTHLTLPTSISGRGTLLGVAGAAGVRAESKTYTVETPSIVDDEAISTQDNPRIFEVTVSWTGVAGADGYDWRINDENVQRLPGVGGRHSYLRRVDSGKTVTDSVRLRAYVLGGDAGKTVTFADASTYQVPAGETLFSPWTTPYAITISEFGNVLQTDVDDKLPEPTALTDESPVREISNTILDSIGAPRTDSGAATLEIFMLVAMAGGAAAVCFVAFGKASGATGMLVCAGVFVVIWTLGGFTLFALPLTLLLLPILPVGVAGILLFRQRMGG